MLWNLQRLGPGWTGLNFRAWAVNQLVARTELFRKFERADPACDQWRSHQATRIAAGFAEKQTWLITPKPDTREALYASLGPAIVALLSGNWDRLELAVSSVEKSA